MKSNINFLFHLYQPPIQTPEILDKVIKESYRPFFALLKEVDDSPVTLNIQGCLIKRLKEAGYDDIIEDIRYLSNQEKIYLTKSVTYHSILPYMPDRLIESQFNDNENIINSILGIKSIDLFFPPELYISQRVIEQLKLLKINNVVISELSIKNSNSNNKFDKVFHDDKYDMNFYVRDSMMSNLLTLPHEFQYSNLLDVFCNYVNQRDFTFLVFDQENFGHHFSGRLEFIRMLFLKFKGKVKPIINEPLIYDREDFQDFIIKASWENIKVNNKIVDMRWSNSDNPIHRYHWKLFNLVYNSIDRLNGTSYNYEELIKAINFWSYSCQFWWASAYPFWHPNNVLEGAFGLLKLTFILPDDIYAKKAQRDALLYYKKIAQYILEWERGNLQKERIKEYDINLNKKIKFYEDYLHII